MRVRDHHETVLAGHLSNCCAETFLPLYRSRRVWSDRVKELNRPLFPHYIFCRFALRERISILRVPGVYDILSFGRTPAPIPDEEIAALQTATGSGLPCLPWPFLDSGTRVTMSRGPLRDLTGIVVREKGAWRLVLSVELLHRAVAVEVNREDVTPV